MMMIMIIMTIMLLEEINRKKLNDYHPLLLKRGGDIKANMSTIKSVNRYCLAHFKHNIMLLPLCQLMLE